MAALTLYVFTLIVFLALDLIGITQLIRPVFDRHVGHLLAEPLRMGPAEAFYAAYIAGVLIGLMCYGTYEFTNYATLRD